MFLALAAILAALPGPYREGLARGVRATVLRPVLQLQQGSVERHARFDDPDRLRAERDSLAAYLVGQAALVTENRELRELLGLRQKLPLSFVPAEIVRVPGRAAEGYFQITVGSEQGVRAGAPIVAPGGLVGQVRSVDRNIAFGLDWLNPEFRASAMTLDGQIYGIVEPRVAPGGEQMLALTGTPRHVQLEPNTMIVTSGHGGVYPRGIPIGRVASVEGRETSWQRNYLIRPSVSPSQMTYVLVLGAPQESLAGVDLARAWGIQPRESMAVDTAAAAAAARAAAATQGRQAPAQTETAPVRSTPRPGGPPVIGVPVTESQATDTAN
ncbi:MAG TPA: rod shape-determining protein MreC [Longimicrobiaceae bacterium]